MFPVYRFTYPRPSYSLDLRPFYNVTDADPDEVIVNNGVITAALAPNGSHDGYLPCALRRITAPPFTLGAHMEPTFFIWGYDDDGFHMINNVEAVMDFSLKGIKYSLEQIQNDGKTNRNWEVELEYNALPEKRVIIATIRYKNKSDRIRKLNIAGFLKNPQVTYSLEWTQVTPETGKVNAVYKPNLGTGAIETSSMDNKAYLVFGFNRQVHSYSVTSFDEEKTWRLKGAFSGQSEIYNAGAHNQYLSHSFGSVAPGSTVSLSMVIAIGDTPESTRADFLDTINNRPMRLKEAEEYWARRWKETKYEINTPEPAINRMSEIAMINGILGHDPVNKAWITSCGSSFRGVTFVWDQYYSNYGLLTSANRSAVKKVLMDTSSMDLTSNNFYQIADRKRLGYHYAYQHYGITVLTYKYVTLFGDIEFLNEKLDNGLTVIENLSAQAKYIVYGLNLDFGATWELLECVRKYIKDIPDLTANTCWMAERIRAMALSAGRPDIATQMDDIRDKAFNKLQSLWDPDEKWFKTYRGRITYTCQIFLSILSEVLNQEQIDGLMSRIDDFVDAAGVKSLAAYDEEFEEKSRGDFNGPSSYVGTAGEFANVLNYVGDRKRLYKLVKGISKWWQWRPFQPQGIDSATGKADGLIAAQGTNNCASVYMSMVPMNLIGIRPAIGGLDIYECYPEQWSNRNGKALFNGKRYSAMASVPYKNYKYTFYVDKQEEKAVTYSYASIFAQDGSFIQEWHGQRLPDMGRDCVFILHFESGRPLIENMDILTRMTVASEESISLDNPFSDIQFTINRKGSSSVMIRVKGMGNGRYTVYEDGKVLAYKISADPDGNFELLYSMTKESSHLYFSLVPAGKEDLALNCAISAESSIGEGYEAKHAVDGNIKTAWVSRKTQLPHWIKVDLGEQHIISRVDICLDEIKDDEYKVQISTDGYNWKAVAVVIDKVIKGLRTHTFEPIKARYVRVVITNRSFSSAVIHAINVY